MSVPTATALPVRSGLLAGLHARNSADGWLSRDAVSEVARACRIPVAEAWEAATSYPQFAFAPPIPGPQICMGLSCVLNGAALPDGAVATGCQFRCFDAPAPGADAAFPEAAIRVAGPLLEADSDDWRGFEQASAMSRDEALAAVVGSGLRGRGGAYFPVGRKWESALAEQRPIALVVNAEEGEPGVFKDRALLGRRPRRFIEGLAIAMRVLAPALTVVFVNGEARAARESLEVILPGCDAVLPYSPTVISGGGGYVLGEETTLLNAIEGRKPAPRLRPPYPVESGLFGMPTVVNNVETIANLSVLFRNPEAFRPSGTDAVSGTKLLSLSGRIRRPGLYEVPLGTPLSDVLNMAGGPIVGDITAALVGGPSGGFLPPTEFGEVLRPGLMHPTGAVTGSGGIVVLDSSSDIRMAALAMAAYNAEESCGKCTPCREGSPRLHALLTARSPGPLEPLLEVLGAASLCGLGQMAPGPVRSALFFWPELFS